MRLFYLQPWSFHLIMCFTQPSFSDKTRILIRSPRSDSIDLANAACLQLSIPNVKFPFMLISSWLSDGCGFLGLGRWGRGWIGSSSL
ncbi:hypothetical protein BKA64DRAFT_664821 [Cadophora sp. MPI-SDFR-AT-0126]|nr:hypothetical protein BKA64DRAFT_664821 [Leotiomycetes sp. MPI-SDFR-AT-0126]